MAKNINGGGATKYRTAEQNNTDRRAAAARKKKAAKIRSAARVAAGEAPKAPIGRPGIKRQAAAAHKQRELRKCIAAEAITNDLELTQLRETITELEELLPTITDKTRRQQAEERLRQLHSLRMEVEALITTFGVESSTSRSFADSVKEVRGSVGRAGYMARKALLAARPCVAA